MRIMQQTIDLQPQDFYEHIYSLLNDLRELFHSEGTIDDSNAKLDEVVKLIALALAIRENKIRVSSDFLKNRDNDYLQSLNSAFKRAADSTLFSLSSGSSLFGESPKLAFESGDEIIAQKMMDIALTAVGVHGGDGNRASIDTINEAFGHFVRDTFRNNIEDAQYMTPPEVVSFMVDIALHDLEKFNILKKQQLARELIVVDPTCGVGSFLVDFRHAYENQAERTSPRIRTVGQDKVGRMVRLTKMNMLLSGRDTSEISNGNSLSDDSALVRYNGKVDLLLTNPPFGARIETNYIKRKCRASLPLLSGQSFQSKTIDTELIFLDRYLSLLRPGGICLAILPDSVVSATGLPRYMRKELANQANIRAIVGLPSVTFAQAGTRTKTVILYFQKKNTGITTKSSVFFGEAEKLGFEVVRRKGVPIKKQRSDNDLPAIFQVFKNGRSSKKNEKLDSLSGFCSFLKLDISSYDTWTPRQFRNHSIQRNRKKSRGSTESHLLADLVVIGKAKRKAIPYNDTYYYIGVPHVVGEGILDIKGIMNYKPVTPGLPVKPGEVLFSRINPRIPRIIVAPDLGRPLLCSSEFEILVPKDGVKAYWLTYLLYTDYVQEQVDALTSGTSASHARIKSERLYDVAILFPNKGTRKRTKLDGLVKLYENSITDINTSLSLLIDCRAKETIISE